jgi:hypothetical protein
MKTLVSSFVLLIVTSQTLVQASQFIGPTTPSNRFILTTNQVALISGIYPKFLFDTNELQIGSEVPQLGASIITSTSTNSVYMGECKQGLTALAGPLELVVSNTVAINYSLITNSIIQSAIILPGSTNNIVIPSGQTIHFMSFGIDGGNPLIADAHLIVGANEFPGYNIYGEAEFDGPLTIRFIFPASVYGQPNEAYTLPYYIADQAVVLPDQAALQSPTGNFEVQLQKSSDLANWYPSVVLPASGAVKAFYRIEISK